ncbi:MAG: NAD(+)/NADH kinase [Verrucomicrobiota bacterium]
MAAKRIGIDANSHKPEAEKALRDLLGLLSERGVEAFLSPDAAKILGRESSFASLQSMGCEIDLLLVLGGDGTILEAVRSIGQPVCPCPILGLNVGHLGFLTYATTQDLEGVIDEILEGHYQVTDRMALNVEVFVGEQQKRSYHVLNEVTIKSDNIARMVRLKTSVDDSLMSVYNADGLIVATPTGSTAYSMSATGPVVHPGAHSLVLSPICPHTLTNRSVVVAAESRVTVEPMMANPAYPIQAVVTIDGQISEVVPKGGRIEISRSKHSVPLVFPTDYSFFETLRIKLAWHGGHV